MPVVTEKYYRHVSNTRILLCAIAVLLGAFGYQIFAPFLLMFPNEGSSPAFFLRAAIAFCALPPLLASRSKSTLLFVPMFVFLSLYLARVFENSISTGGSMYIGLGVAFLFLVIGGMLPAAVAARSAVLLHHNTAIKLFWYMGVIFIAGFIINAESVFTNYQGRFGLSNINPISVASTAGSIGIFFTLYLLDQKRNITCAFSAAMILAMAVILLWTGARGPLVALTLALCTFGLISPFWQRVRLIQVLIVVLVLTIVFSVITGLDYIEFMVARFARVLQADVSYDVTNSASFRLLLWLRSWDQFLDNPIIGKYIFELGTRTHPHQLFLESLISVGLFGTLILFLHLAIVFRSAITLAHRKNNGIINRFAILIFFKSFFESQFSGAIWGNTTFWIFGALVIALAYTVPDRARH